MTFSGWVRRVSVTLMHGCSQNSSSEIRFALNGDMCYFFMFFSIIRQFGSSVSGTHGDFKRGDRLLSDNTTVLYEQHSGKLLSDFEPW